MTTPYSVEKTLLALLFLFLIIPTKSQTWQMIGQPGFGNVSDIDIYNGDLYITGDFDVLNGDSVKSVARWDGTAWRAMGPGLGLWTYGNSLEVYNNELYVAGYFQTIPGVNNTLLIAKWNGTSWTNAGTGLTMMGIPKDMLAVGDRLYIGGSTQMACNTPYINFVYWDGTNYHTPGSGELRNSGIASGTVFSITELAGEIYAGGIFDNVDGVTTQGLVKWNGNNYTSVSTGLPGSNSTTIELTNGSITSNRDDHNVYRYVGGNWQAICQGCVGNWSVYDIIEFQGMTIIGGQFNTSHHAPLYLNGNNSWVPLGSIPEYTTIAKMAVINNELYAVGYQKIDTLGFIQDMTFVAKWSGSVDIGEQKQQGTKVFPSPVTDMLRIDLPEGLDVSSIRLLDVNGKIFREIGNAGAKELDLSDLGPGLYFLEIRSGEGLEFLKVMKI